MIRIEAGDGEIVVKPCDGPSRRELNKPLNRLFLGSTLGASPSAEGQWHFSAEDDVADRLAKLTAHFTKSGIEFQLDQYCASELQERTDRQTRFARRLKDAQSVKDESADLDKPTLQRLSQGFVRDLTLPQRHALRHLMTVENGANFSVPGSGKTSVVLAYFHLLRSEGITKTLLVVGPFSSFRPWEDEYRACFGRSSVTARFPGVARSDRQDMYLTADQYDLLLTSYHTAARDQEELIEMFDSRDTLLVLDESHYVKRPVGGQLADAVLRLAPHAVRRVILTGTPMPNGLEDIWSQITFLWPSTLPLGSSDSYLFRVRRSNDDNTLRDDIRARISPLFYRVSKGDLGLPRPSYRIVRCDLSPAQARIYKGVAARFLSQTSEAPGDQDVLMEWRRARAVRLIQIAVNPTLLRKSSLEFRIPPYSIEDEGLKSLINRYAEFEVPAKVNQACAIARQVCEGGRKALVWSTFVHNLTMLGEHLSDLQPAIIHGGVPYGSPDSEEVSREQEIERFKHDEGCHVLIANPAACAESISLHTVCHDAIYLDRSFNCAHYLQSLDRIHRLGLAADSETNYYLLLANDTVDEVVHSRLEAKMERLRQLVEPDLPGEVPGYWGEEGEEEAERDFSLVEDHLRRLGSK